MLKICLVFWKSEPRYAYKRYAYKKKCSRLKDTRIKELFTALKMQNVYAR